MIWSATGIIRALRNSHGFGVHSPLAVNLLRSVIRPHRNEGYYGYQTIRSEAYSTRRQGRPCSHKDVNRACLILRLTAFLRPESVFLSSSESHLWHTAVRCADSRTPVVSHRHSAAALYVAGGHDATRIFMSDVSTLPEAAFLLFDIGGDNIRILKKAMHEGVMFENGSSCLIVKRRDMQPQIYSILPRHL